MSKIKYLSAFLLLFTAFAFTSCDDNEPIDSAIVLNPEQGCTAPTSFQASNFIGGTNVNLTWIAGSEETSWEIQYGQTGFALGNGTSVFAETTSATIINLIATNSYQFYIRSNCSDDSVSSWVGPIAVNSAGSTTCTIPTALMATRTAANPTEITMNWTSAGTATSWEVQYGTSGFTLGTGTTITVNATTAQISGLVATTSYDFYVRSICSATDASSWTAKAVVPAPGGVVATGDYWPAAVNNQWTFSQNGTLQSPMKMIGTNTFNGATYYKFTPQTVNSGGTTITGADTWLNKNNGVYTLKTGDLDISAGGLSGVQTGFEFVVLKDNIAVNQTWSGSYSQSTSYMGIPAIIQTTTYTGKILEKDVAATVNGQNFTNVIKVNIAQETSTMGTITISNIEYWYAKNIGPIKIKMLSGTQTYESVIVNYTVN